MSLTRRSVIKTVLASAAVAATQAPWRPAHGSQALRIVSPFNPGGVNDVLARGLAQPLGGLVNQTVIVENRPGAGGSIGAGYVARSAADGNTLLMGIVDTQSIIEFIYRKLPYNPDKDLTPISLVTNIPIVLMVGKTLSQLGNICLLYTSPSPRD